VNLFAVHSFSPKFVWLSARMFGGQFAHRVLSMVLLFAVHSRSGIIDFLSSVPSFVSAYSTRGGISAKDSRVIRPSV